MANGEPKEPRKYYELKVKRIENKPSKVDQAFIDRGIMRHNILSYCGVNNSSGNRLLNGTTITVEGHIRKLFAPLTYLVEDFRNFKGKPLSEDKLQATIEQFCTITSKERKRPTAPRQKATPEAVIKCMTVYVKFIHLRDRRHNDPVYTKVFPRRPGSHPVFDEVVITRQFEFNTPPSHFVMMGSTKGENDLQMLIPPLLELTPDQVNRFNVKSGIVEHCEKSPGSLLCGAFTMINACQAGGDEWIGSFIPLTCERLVFIVDMTSLAAYHTGQLFTGPIVAYHYRGTKPRHRVRMAVETSDSGAFVVDTEKTATFDEEPNWKANDQLIDCDEYRMYFPINWETVAEAGGRKKSDASVHDPSSMD